MTSTTISFQDDVIEIRLRGFRSLFALQKRVVLPLSRVESVTFETSMSIDRQKDRPGKWYPGMRIGGIRIKNVYNGGKFFQERSDGWDRVFWDVKSQAPTICIQLHDDYYKTVYVEVDDASTGRKLVKTITARLSAWSKIKVR
jgi:hypothetical protein